MKRLIVFDLDGTLNQTENYGVPSMLGALNDMGYTGFTAKDIIGTFGAKDEDTERFFFGDKAREKSKEYWQRVADYMHGPYKDAYAPFEGVVPLLQWLQNEGYMTAVCSNTNEPFIKMVLGRLKITEYIDVIQETAPGLKKEDSLGFLLKREQPDMALMVGDRYFDKVAADKNHIPFAGCLYGYGKPEEFEGAAVLLNSPLDLIAYLKG